MVGFMKVSLELAESAKVLDLLLSIVYRLDRAKSNLRSADFDVLKAVTEATEMYTIEMISDLCEVYIWCVLFCAGGSDSGMGNHWR